MLLIVGFVYPQCIYSEPTCMCLGQRNNPKCKFGFRQCFAAIFERWWCFAIKSAVHTSSLKQVLISHPSIQMHFYFHQYLSCLHCSANKGRKLRPELFGFLKQFYCTTLTSNDKSVSSFFFFSFLRQCNSVSLSVHSLL